jgi:hypothetical protein
MKHDKEFEKVEIKIKIFQIITYLNQLNHICF